MISNEEVPVTFQSLADEVSRAIQTTPTPGPSFSSPYIAALCPTLEELEKVLRANCPFAAVGLCGRSLELLIRCELAYQGVAADGHSGLYSLVKTVADHMTRRDATEVRLIVDFIRPFRNGAVHGDPEIFPSKHAVAMIVHGVLHWHERLFPAQPTNNPVPTIPSGTAIDPMDSVMLISSPKATAPGLTPVEAYEAARRSWRVSEWRARSVPIVGIVDSERNVRLVYRIQGWEPDPNAPGRLCFIGSPDPLEKQLAGLNVKSFFNGQSPVRYVTWGQLNDLLSGGTTP